MLVPNFEIIITKPFPAALIPSPFRFYGDIYKLVYTMSLCGATVSATSRKPAYKYRPQSPIYKLTCVAYKNKIQNRLRALVIGLDDKMFNFTKRKPIIFNYTLHDHILATVTQAKYLGVTITNDLNWKQHVENITKSANKALGFLRRNLRINSVKAKEQAYLTYVRPILEYSCTVWDPYRIPTAAVGNGAATRSPFCLQSIPPDIQRYKHDGWA